MTQLPAGMSASSLRLNKGHRSGFTLFELLLVVGLIAVCGSMLVPAVGSWLQRQKEDRVLHGLRRSLFVKREEAIQSAETTVWLVPAAEDMPGVQIALQPSGPLLFLPDGTANNDRVITVTNATQQTIGTLIVEASTGSIILAKEKR